MNTRFMECVGQGLVDIQIYLNTLLDIRYPLINLIFLKSDSPNVIGETLTFSCPITMTTIQLSGVGWQSCFVILC